MEKAAPSEALGSRTSQALEMRGAAMRRGGDGTQAFRGRVEDGVRKALAFEGAPPPPPSRCRAPSPASSPSARAHRSAAAPAVS
jgi:hypothetical protein